MIDVSELKSNRLGRVFHILSIPGKNTVGFDWAFLREESAGKYSKQYVFGRLHSKDSSKRIEINLSSNQLERVYEVTANRPEQFRLDIARLEAFRLEHL